MLGFKLLFFYFGQKKYLGKDILASASNISISKNKFGYLFLTLKGLRKEQNTQRETDKANNAKC